MTLGKRSPAVAPTASIIGFTPARLAAAAALVVVVVSALAFFADYRALSSALGGFTWWLTAPILGLTLAGYALRFARWQLYLRSLALPPLPTGTSALVFLSGFSMSVTPGKMGEVIKSVFLRRLVATPISRTSAIVVAERVTDVLAMLVLASIGAFSFAYGRPFLIVAVPIAVGGVLLLQRPRLLSPLLGRVGGWPVIGPRVHHAAHFLDAAGALLRPRRLLAAVGLSVAAWAAECLAFWLVLIGLDLEPSGHLLLVATFVLALASLLGAVSMLPGGLGVAEASVVGMLLLLLGDDLDRGVASAATLLIRFATLWFAVGLGAAALLLLQRVVARADALLQPATNAAPSVGAVEASRH